MMDAAALISQLRADILGPNADAKEMLAELQDAFDDETAWTWCGVSVGKYSIAIIQGRPSHVRAEADRLLALPLEERVPSHQIAR